MVQYWEITNDDDACQNSRDKNRLELSGRILEYVKYLNFIENILTITGWNQTLHSMAKLVQQLNSQYHPC